MNPQMLMQMLNSGNPAMMINQMAQGNPIMQRALDMTRGKTPAECEAIVRNLARQRGMSDEQLNMFISQFGFRL